MLNILLDLCSDSRFLRILYLFKVITRLICIVVPILLILVLMVDTIKAIINSDDSKINALKKSGLTKIIMAVVVFLIPTFISVFLNLFKFAGYDTCINNATPEKIQEAKEREEIEKRNEQYSREQQFEQNMNYYNAELRRINIPNNSNSGGNSSVSYNFSAENSNILHESLSTFLTRNGSSIEQLNNLLTSNVQRAGYQTREGVVAAATTLVGELNDKYGKRLPYYWGGGHTEIVQIPGNLGSDDACTDISANNTVYKYCGFDCTGFIMWAIRNAGFKYPNSNQVASYNGAQKVDLSPSKPVLKAGDILESDTHAVLIVGIDEGSNQYVCVEALGNSSGILFSKRSYARSGYLGVDMSGFYNNPNNKLS